MRLTCLRLMRIMTGFTTVSAMVSAMPIDIIQLFDVIVMLVSAVMLLLFSFKKKEINRTSGIIFILVYVAYFTYIIIYYFIIILHARNFYFTPYAKRAKCAKCANLCLWFWM